jgi:hypothetical protein
MATIDMTHAYADRTLKSLVRQFVLDGDGTIQITDSYRFSRKPRSLEEAFVTYEDVRVAKAGRSVAIGRGAKKVTLRAKGAGGVFAAERLVEESKEGRTDGVVTRITFVPAELTRDMTLTFTIV